MSTLVNLLLAIVLNLLGVQVHEHVQENQSADMNQIEINLDQQSKDCIETDTLYNINDTLTL